MSTSTAQITSTVSPNMKYESFSWADDVEDSLLPDLKYQSFDWADDVEEFESSKISLDLSSPTIQTNDYKTKSAIESYYDDDQEDAEDCNLLGYGLNGSEPGRLQKSIAWTLSPLACSLEAMLAYGRRDNGLVPAIIVTDENGQHHQVKEVKKPLWEDSIASILFYRMLATTETEEERKERFAWEERLEQPKTSGELIAAFAAREWWAAEQRKRDAAYEGWEVEEVKEYQLEKAGLQMEIDKILGSSEARAGATEQQKIAKKRSLVMAMRKQHALKRRRQRVSRRQKAPENVDVPQSGVATLHVEKVSAWLNAGSDVSEALFNTDTEIAYTESVSAMSDLDSDPPGRLFSALHIGGLRHPSLVGLVGLQLRIEHGHGSTFTYCMRQVHRNQPVATAS